MEQAKNSENLSDNSKPTKGQEAFNDYLKKKYEVDELIKKVCPRE